MRGAFSMLASNTFSRRDSGRRAQAWPAEVATHVTWSLPCRGKTLGKTPTHSRLCLHSEGHFHSALRSVTRRTRSLLFHSLNRHSTHSITNTPPTSSVIDACAIGYPRARDLTLRDFEYLAPIDLCWLLATELLSRSFTYFAAHPKETFRSLFVAKMTDIDTTRRNKKPRQLQENERARLDEFIDSIGYSAR
jgi:hypothetical protein